MTLFSNKKIILLPRRDIDRDISYEDNAEPQPTPIDFDTLYKAYEECTELNSVINTLASDIIKDGYTISDIDGKSETKRTNRMVKHLGSINFNKKLKNFIIHCLISGDGFLEIKMIENLNKKVSEIMNKMQFITKEDITAIQKNLDEQLYFPFNIWNVKSSTIEIANDEKGQIDYYIQTAGGNKPVTFMPENIIHFPVINLGETYGISPTYPILDDVVTLINAKKYAGKFFENGGHINRLYIIENGRGIEDRNYKLLKHEIRESRKSRNWQKDLVMTGKIKTEKLNEFNRDLEFKDLMTLMTNNIYTQFGVPPIRMGKAGQLKDNTKEMNANYLAGTVNSWQKDLEHLLNKHIFSKFNLILQFRRSYKIDEIREANITATLYDRGLLSTTEARERMGYLEDIDSNDINPKLGNEEPHRDTGDKQEGGRGTGEDRGAKLDKSYEEVLELGLEDFISVVEKLFPINEAKVFYKRIYNGYELYFSDQVYKYKTTISEEEFNRRNYNLSFWIGVK